MAEPEHRGRSIDAAVVAGTRTRAELDARDDLDVAAEVAWALYRDAPTEDVNLSMRAAIIGALAVLQPSWSMEVPIDTDSLLVEHLAGQVREQERQRLFDAWERGYEWGAGDGPRRLNPYRPNHG